MNPEDAETLPAEIELALAHTPAPVRERLRTYFAFDQRLGRIVSATTEPMLGQMRLAWWRDMLAMDPDERPRGDAVLEAIGHEWGGDGSVLSKVVDGWEVLVAAEEIGDGEIETFAESRAAPFVAMLAQKDAPIGDLVLRAGTRWACADAASKLSDAAEKANFLRVGLAIPRLTARLPREFLGLAVLNALALRALNRGGHPLMEGRGAAITAMRAALIGR
ncbi:MAG: hypothetical protein QNJ15_14885 [Erythrobacter sp.]|nr:hypothetical protein [Erythrobacter sp.]